MFIYTNKCKSNTNCLILQNAPEIPCNNECRLGKQEHGCLIPLHYVRGKCNNLIWEEGFNKLVNLPFLFLSAYTFRILAALRSSVSDNPQTVMTFSGGEHVSRRYRKRDVKCFPGVKGYSSKHMLRITGSDTSARSAAWTLSDWSAPEFCDMPGLRKGKPQAEAFLAQVQEDDDWKSCPYGMTQRYIISHTECLGPDMLTSVSPP